MLWLSIGKNIRNDSGKGHVVGTDKIIASLIDIKFYYQFGLAQQPSSEYYNEVYGPDCSFEY